MLATFYSKTLENFYQTTRCHILDYTNLEEISSHYFFRYFWWRLKVSSWYAQANTQEDSVPESCGWSAPRLRRHTTGKEPVLIGHEAEWPGRAKEISLPVGQDVRTVQTVARLYTDYSIPRRLIFWYLMNLHSLRKLQMIGKPKSFPSADNATLYIFTYWGDSGRTMYLVRVTGYVDMGEHFL